jgi:hypothetical protein
MSKETVYDEQINPLMAQIIEICKEHKIAALANFRLDEDLCCTTALLADEYDPSDEQLEALSLLKKKPFAMAVTEETKPNGDKKLTMRRIS